MDNLLIDAAVAAGQKKAEQPDPQIENLESRFKNYARKMGAEDRYSEVRKVGMFFSETLLKTVPESRERSLAITKIEEAMMWANAAIDRNDNEKV